MHMFHMASLLCLKWELTPQAKSTSCSNRAIIVVAPLKALLSKCGAKLHVLATLSATPGGVLLSLGLLS